MIEICGVTKSYGPKRALDEVTFAVPEGSVTGFVGPNGAGKSTLMRVAMGLERPDAGEIRFDGHPLDGRPAGQFGAGALLDPSWTLPRRTALDHLWLVSAALGLGRREAMEALALTGLADAAAKPIGSFSLGMRQRLGIASAVLARPRTLLLDEPVNGLDPDGVSWVRRFVRTLATQGTAVLISSHLLSELAQTADRIVMIGGGRVLYEGPLSELLVTDRAVTMARSDDDVRLAGASRIAGAQVSVQPDQRLQITGLTPLEVSRLARDQGLLLTHLSAATASLEERFAALTDEHVQYRADVTAGAGR